jgi:hypothetical protein
LHQRRLIIYVWPAVAAGVAPVAAVELVVLELEHLSL